MTPGPDTPSHTGHPSADTLLDLLERWEEEYRLGRDVPAEELCPDRPDLHGLLRQRIARRKRLLGMLRSGPGGGGGTPALPQVPGYEVRRVLGRGGVGVVYEAVAVALGRPVALKMLSALSPGEAALARFRAEGQALAKLRHPNIVQVYEVGTHAGLPYMALELLDESLADRLREAPLPPGQAAALAEVLARAVRHAHRQGILHRDLKPGNVLLRTERDADTADPGSTCRLHALDCTPKVADFGLARLVGEERGHTRTGDLLGTPSYMAPEQAGGSPDRVGPAADVYALGAILYECLTGRPPFRGATALDTLHQIRCDEPVPPRSLQPKVPRDLETVCLKCLEKDPAKRYPSAAALADDLRRFLDGKPVRARPVSPVARAWKWARRRPAAAGLVAVSVLAVAAVLGVGAAYNARLQGALDVARGANRDLARSAYAVFATGDQTRLTPPTRRMVEAAVRSYEGLLGEVSEPAERADLLDEVGMLLFILNRDDGAEETFRRAAGAMRSAVATREQLLAEDPGDPRRRAAMAGSLYQLGDLLAAHSDTDEAEPIIRRSIALRRELAGEFPGDPDHAIELAYAQILMGRVQFYKRRNYREALAWLVPATETLDADRRSAAPRQKKLFRLFDALAVCARAHAELGDWEQAVAYWDRALQDTSLTPRLRQTYRIGRAFALARLGRYRESQAALPVPDEPERLFPALLVDAALVHALNAAAAARDANLSSPERESAAKDFADRAVAMLLLAERKGALNSPAARDRIRNARGFAELRHRPEVQQLLARLSGAGADGAR